MVFSSFVSCARAQASEEEEEEIRVRLRDVWPWLRAEFSWRVLSKRYKVILSEYAQWEIRKAIERRGNNPYSGDREDLEEEEADG